MKLVSVELMDSNRFEKSKNLDKNRPKNPLEAAPLHSTASLPHRTDTAPRSAEHRRTAASIESLHSRIAQLISLQE